MRSARTRSVTAAVLVALAAAPILHGAADTPAMRIEQDVRFLAADELEGREAGTRGYDVAARFVAERFRALGLPPAFDAGYFQPVPLHESRPDPAATRLVLHLASGPRTLAAGDEFAPMANAFVEDVAVEAPMVFVGHGIDAPELGQDDYHGLDVDGKVVVALSGAPASLPGDSRAVWSPPGIKAAAAARRGAIGFLLLRGSRQDERFPWELARAVFAESVHWRDERGGLHSLYRPESAAIRAAAVLSTAVSRALLEGAATPFDALAEAAESGPVRGFALAARVTMRTATRHRRFSSANVVARLPGSDPSLAHEHVLLTAHLDHLGQDSSTVPDGTFNGALDNAAGVAVLLEVTRAFRHAAPRRSLLFAAVTAEEAGLLGSDYLAHHLPGAVVANVNVDMPLLLHPLVDVVLFGERSSSLGTTAGRVAAELGIVVRPDPDPAAGMFVRSDQFSFLRRGIPALFVDVGMGGGADELHADWLRERYHRPTDDVDQPIDWEAAARLARFNHAIREAVATAPAPPAWHVDAVVARMFGARARTGEEER